MLLPGTTTQVCWTRYSATTLVNTGDSQVLPATSSATTECYARYISPSDSVKVGAGAERITCLLPQALILRVSAISASPRLPPPARGAFQVQQCNNPHKHWVFVVIWSDATGCNTGATK